MLKVLCFGNPHFENDKLALEVGRIIKNKQKKEAQKKIKKGKTRAPGAKSKKNKTLELEVIECGLDFGELDKLSASELDSVVVLDVVKGLKRVRFVDVTELKISRTITAHDIDVAFYLKLLAKDGKKVKIIGIPDSMKEGTAWKGVLECLEDFAREKNRHDSCEVLA